jgi:hypothetical protein
MPVSSVSGLISTSAYFAAVLLLMVVLIAPAGDAYHDASERAASVLAGGIAQQIDALSPGMKTDLEIGSFPGITVSVTFSASVVTATVDGASATQSVLWTLPPASLSPGHQYTLGLNGGLVIVE